MSPRSLIKYTILSISVTICLLAPHLGFCKDKDKFKSALVHRAIIMRTVKHDAGGALQLLQSAAEKERLDPSYEDEVACCLLDLGRLDECISQCNKVLAKDAKDETPYRCRALAYKDKGEYKKAIAEYTKLIELNPVIAANYNDRAKLYKIIGQEDLARKDLATAQNVQRYDALALDEKSLKMTLLLRGGYYQEAETLLPDYLRAKPRKIFYLSDIAKLFAMGNRGEASIKCANRYLQLATEAKTKDNLPKDTLTGLHAADETTVRELLINQYLKKKELDKAMAVADPSISKLQELAQQNADEHGQASRAQVNLARLLTARAQIYLAQGKNDQARKDLERSLSIYPQSKHTDELLKSLTAKR